jgi:hypothetical protein
LTQHQTRRLTWSQFNPAIGDITDVESLDTAIKRLGSLDLLLLSIKPVVGADAGEETLGRLKTLKEELQERAFLLEWYDDPNTLANLDLTTRLPDGILQRVDEALSTILEGRIPEDPAHAFAGEERTTVQEARTLLYRLARGEA